MIDRRKSMLKHTHRLALCAGIFCALGLAFILCRQWSAHAAASADRSINIVALCYDSEHEPSYTNGAILAAESANAAASETSPNRSFTVVHLDGGGVREDGSPNIPRRDTELWLMRGLFNLRNQTTIDCVSAMFPGHIAKRITSGNLSYDLPISMCVDLVAALPEETIRSAKTLINSNDQASIDDRILKPLAEEGKTRVAILYDDSTDSSNIANYIVKVSSDYGINVADKFEPVAILGNEESIAARWKTAGIDTVIVCITDPTFLTDPVTSFLEQYETVTVPGIPALSTDSAAAEIPADFREAYQERFGIEPDVYAAWGYFNTAILCDAMAKN